jgi:FkbM family methyltransferase
MTIKILYGIKENRKDVTEICLTKLTNNNIITIPNGDNNRARLFSDHLVGKVKTIYIVIDDREFEYDHLQIIKVNLNNSTIHVSDEKDFNNKLSTIHSKLQLKYGTFKDELPEQKMAVRYLSGNERVLEIGGNIGRNSLIIASIVNNDTFVTLESDIRISKQLAENRDINKFTFHIENSALSKRKLIQKGWETKPSDVLQSGHVWVNTINLDELKSKYKIDFDTLILDCEGAFYYILMDMPEILDGIKLIIMENDYNNIAHKNYVDSVLKDYNFYNEYKEAGGWGCCYNNFFEVWKKSAV